MKKQFNYTDFVDATNNYESWLGSHVELNKSELAYKHAQMALANDVFPFFRGTYYRWAEIWPQICPDLQSAPQVLAVGDLHIENYGTWRDSEGRLVWGVNDFDEVDTLPFTNDLVRLVASAIIGVKLTEFTLSLKTACRAVLKGYVSQLERAGEPFVLEERHTKLRRLATHSDRNPIDFWKKMTKVSKVTTNIEVATEVREILEKELRASNGSCDIRPRSRVGMGSLGKPRFLALAEIEGSWMAREAKALTPPATASFSADLSQVSHMTEILSRAVRCPDPFVRINEGWIVRRLAPRCSRIEVALLSRIEDEKVMFMSMGAETANIHCGTLEARDSILQWLDSRKSNWLEKSALDMVAATRDDWKAWKKHHTKGD